MNHKRIYIGCYHLNKPSKVSKNRGAWVAQLVRRLTSAQVLISWLVSLSPMLGSVLAAHSLEPALDSVSPSLSLPFGFCVSLSHSTPPPMLCLSLSQK